MKFSSQELFTLTRTTLTAQSTLTSPTRGFIYVCLQASVRVTIEMFILCIFIQIKY